MLKSTCDFIKNCGVFYVLTVHGNAPAGRPFGAIMEHEGKLFGNHYIAMVSDDIDEQPNVIKGDTFSILSNHNGTNVMRYAAKID